MKLSSETITILKNFASINSGIFLKKGTQVKTVSTHKNILAQATIPDSIPADFGIYDLNEFLSVISLHKDDIDLEFDSKNIILSGRNGRSKIKYRSCDPTMIVVAPEKEIQMPDCEISFILTAEDFRWILDAANVLGSPQISIESDGNKVTINTIDVANDSAHTESLELNVNSSGYMYKILFKTENISKIIPGSYSVKISSKSISEFTNNKYPIKYWISTEVGSIFNGDK